MFTPVHFRDLGNDFGTRKAIQSLCDRGVITRLERGLYLYPKTHPTLGMLSPTPDQIALEKQAASGDKSLFEDAVWLLFDEAKLMDGGAPQDAAAFAVRLTRILEKALGA